MIPQGFLARILHDSFKSKIPCKNKQNVQIQKNVASFSSKLAWKHNITPRHLHGSMGFPQHFQQPKDRMWTQIELCTKNEWKKVKISRFAQHATEDFSGRIYWKLPDCYKDFTWETPEFYSSRRTFSEDFATLCQRRVNTPEGNPQRKIRVLWA